MGGINHDVAGAFRAKECFWCFHIIGFVTVAFLWDIKKGKVFEVEMKTVHKKSWLFLIMSATLGFSSWQWWSTLICKTQYYIAQWNWHSGLSTVWGCAYKMRLLRWFPAPCPLVHRRVVGWCVVSLRQGTSICVCVLTSLLGGRETEPSLHKGKHCLHQWRDQIWKWILSPIIKKKKVARKWSKPADLNLKPSFPIV